MCEFSIRGLASDSWIGITYNMLELIKKIREKTGAGVVDVETRKKLWNS
jgi:hypothetical protein